MKTSENREIKPSWISARSPKMRKYLYAKILAYSIQDKDYDIIQVCKVFKKFRYWKFCEWYMYM